ILLASLFLGWGAGSNDAASAVGTPLGAGMITHRKAVLIVVVFSMLGFLLQGQYVSKTVGSGILPKEFFEGNSSVVLAALISASLVTLLTIMLSLPISINHTLVGGVLGMGVILGMTNKMDYSLLFRIMTCWLTTPLIAMAVTVLFHKLVVTPIAGRMNIVNFSRTFKFLSLLSAIVVSYSLGASAIGAILGITLTSSQLPTIAGIQPETLLGISVALVFGLGVITFSDRVIKTLSSKISLLGPATSFSAQFSAALTVYGFVLMGLPASITHAIVGAIAGVGILKGTRTLNRRTLRTIVFGWIFTPLLSAAIAMLVYKLISA
ncbi:MAG: anion permease, partial [Candidatus Altiarchaeota archaeon]